mgnify:CR=1 FL=1
MAAIEKARAIVLEVNPNVPFANGDCHIHISQVTALVESEEPVLEVGLPKIGPVQEAIGKLHGGRVPQMCMRTQDYFRDGSPFESTGVQTSLTQLVPLHTSPGLHSSDCVQGLAVAGLVTVAWNTSAAGSCVRWSQLPVGSSSSSATIT